MGEPVSALPYARTMSNSLQLPLEEQALGEATPGVLPVTLVVPVRNEQETVGTLIRSIDAQTRQPDEVVFVDGGSTDRTVELIIDKSRTDSRYKVVQAGPATPGRGRNIGLAAARHQWVAMTDAGIRVEPTWLEALWEAQLQDPSSRIVYGNFEFEDPSFFEQCAIVIYGAAKRVTPAGPLRGPTTVSFMVHKDAFREVGGFLDLRAGEDDLFLQAVEDGGIPVAWAPDATVRWRIRPDLPSTFERFRLYSYTYVIAGREDAWHRALARNYAPVVVGAGLAVATSKRWLVLPAAVIVGRVAVRVRRHWGDDHLGPPSPSRLVGAALLLVVSDAATGMGWWQARRQQAWDRRHGTGL